MEKNYRSLYRSQQHKNELWAFYDRVLQNWPVPWSERFIESNSGRTHIIQCGNERGKPLLLFHGTGNNSLMWRYNVKDLGQHFRLFLIDTLNDPGKSEASLKFNPKHDYIHWVNEILAELKFDQVYLLGHSKGGWLALNTVIHNPAKIAKVILLAPAVGINAKLNSTFMRRSIAVGLNPSIKNLTAYFQYMSGPGKEINPQYIEYLSKVIQGTRSKPIKHRQFTDNELKSIQQPTLILFGENEVSVNYPEVIQRAKALIPKLETQIIPGAGHGLQGENPESIDNLIINFLNT